eukprot:g9540.t1
MELRVGKDYRLGRKIGSGSFGDIYLGTNVTTGEEVAIKLKNVNMELPQQISKIYKLLAEGVGIPNFHWYGSNARSVGKEIVNITKDVIQESEVSYQRRLADEVSKLKAEMETNEMRIKKSYEEDILRLKTDIEGTISKYSAQKEIIKNLEEDKKKLQVALDKASLDYENVRIEQKNEFDSKLNQHIKNNNAMFEMNINNMKKQHDVILEEFKNSHAEQIVNIRELYELKISNLNDQIQEINSASSIKTEALEHNIDLLNRQIDKLNSIILQHEEKIAEEIQFHAKTKDNHDSILEKHKTTLYDLEDAHHNKVLKLKNIYSNKLKEKEDVILQKEEHVNKLEAKHNSLLNLKKEEIKQLKHLHSLHIKEVSERHEKVIENIQEMHKSKLNFKAKQHKEQVEELHKKISTHVLNKEKEVQRLKSMHEEHVTIISSRHEEILNEIQTRHEQHKEIHQSEITKISNEINLHKENSTSKQDEINNLIDRIDNLMEEKQAVIRDYDDMKQKYQEIEAKLNDENQQLREGKKILLDALDESRNENNLKNKDIETLTKELKSKLEYIKVLEENSRRDARKSVESVKKLQLMRKEMEAKMKVMRDQHEMEIAEQTKSYSDQLLKVYTPVRLEDETNPEARCSLFIAMLLAGNTICTGPGTISERRLITFLEQVNSPLFSSLDDATNLANRLVVELNPANSKCKANRTVQVSQFAEYILSKLSHHPTSLEKLRTIALASYLKIGSSPRNSPMKKSIQENRGEIFMNNKNIYNGSKNQF